MNAPFQNAVKWVRSQKAAGLMTLAAMLVAFALANSPAKQWYGLVHHLPVIVQVGTFSIDKPLILWINDGLMAFFFLLIAMELKREILAGQLSTSKSIATPAFGVEQAVVSPAAISLQLPKRNAALRATGRKHCRGSRCTRPPTSTTSSPSA